VSQTFTFIPHLTVYSVPSLFHSIVIYVLQKFGAKQYTMCRLIEICFVGDEAFRELSLTDPAADELINKAIAEDKSYEWFAKHDQRMSH
jgi:hypothetical protein